MVSYDANCNGLPDDPFYELAGSAYRDPQTRHGYTITYSRPDPARVPAADGGFITDATYIPWADSEGERLRGPQQFSRPALLAAVA